MTQVFCKLPIAVMHSKNCCEFVFIKLVSYLTIIHAMLLHIIRSSQYSIREADFIQVGKKTRCFSCLVFLDLEQSWFTLWLVLKERSTTNQPCLIFRRKADGKPACPSLTITIHSIDFSFFSLVFQVLRGRALGVWTFLQIRFSTSLPVSLTSSYTFSLVNLFNLIFWKYCLVIKIPRVLWAPKI